VIRERLRPGGEQPRAHARSMAVGARQDGVGQGRAG
jgi:hypothetical protein